MKIFFTCEPVDFGNELGLGVTIERDTKPRVRHATRLPHRPTEVDAELLAWQLRDMADFIEKTAKD